MTYAGVVRHTTAVGGVLLAQTNGSTQLRCLILEFCASEGTATPPSEADSTIEVHVCCRLRWLEF